MEKKLSATLKRMGDEFVEEAAGKSYTGVIFGATLFVLGEEADRLEKLARDIYADATLTEEKAKEYADELKALGVLDD